MKYLIAIPCMDAVQTIFMSSLLNMRKPNDGCFVTCRSSLVYDSRNILAATAIDGGYDRVLWLDSDMSFEPDLMERLIADMDTGLEFVSGLYITRKEPIKPCVYSELRMRYDGQTEIVYCEPWPENSVFEIAGCGFGCVMTDVALLNRVFEKYKHVFTPIPGWGEDISFCIRARECGAKLWCDSRIQLGHIGQAIFNTDTYKLINQ